MQYRIILFLIIAATIISTAQLISIVTTTSTYTASSGVLWNFYISSFCTLSCILGLIIFGIRTHINRINLVRNLLISLRQGALISVVVLLAIFLNTLHILGLWDALPLILAAILIEFFFQAEKRPHARLETHEE